MFEIRFAALVGEHLEHLTARARATVLDAIERQLMHEPLVETRHRKRLRPNPLAPRELRVGTLRVFYEVVPGDPGVVHVLAIGQKFRNVLRIGGLEITL